MAGDGRSIARIARIINEDPYYTLGGRYNIVIAEDISQRDFFDFYALLYAYQERGLPNHDQIAAELRFVVDYITKDHLNQFANMLLNRLPDAKHEETLAVMRQYGLDIDKKTYLTTGMDNLSLQDKAMVLRQVLSFDHEHGFTGQTWFGLTKTFLELVRAPQSLESQILVLDKIYNLLHHGGMITDYMDESNWLESALNYRDNANPAQIFAKASSRIRSVIGRASYVGMDRSPVGMIRQIYTALRRAAGSRNERDDGNRIYIRLDGNRIDISVEYEELVRRGLPDSRYLGQVSIEDRGDYFLVVSGSEEEEVRLPIHKQFEFANDLIDKAISNMRPERRGGQG